MKVRTINRNRSYITKGKRPINTIYENGRTALSDHVNLHRDIEEGFRYFWSKRQTLKASDLL